MEASSLASYGGNEVPAVNYFKKGNELIQEKPGERERSLVNDMHDVR